MEAKRRASLAIKNALPPNTAKNWKPMNIIVPTGILIDNLVNFSRGLKIRRVSVVCGKNLEKRKLTCKHHHHVAHLVSPSVSRGFCNQNICLKDHPKID
jgi:hypothetical protein